MSDRRIRRGQREPLQSFLERKNKGINARTPIAADGAEISQGPEGFSMMPFPGLRTASGFVTETITARTGSYPTVTLGVGKVLIINLQDGVYDLADADAEVDVQNGRMSPVLAGKFVDLIEIDGHWRLLLADCGSY